MIIILADVSKVQLHRKMRIIKYGVDQLLCQLEDWRNNKTSVFCLHNVKYTNVSSPSLFPLFNRFISI